MLYKIINQRRTITTDAQGSQNQKHGILEYANQIGISDIQVIEDTISGAKKWKQRKLGIIGRKASKKDNPLQNLAVIRNSFPI